MYQPANILITKCIQKKKFNFPQELVWTKTELKGEEILDFIHLNA